MLEALTVPQMSALLQRRLDLRIGIKDPLATEALHGVEKPPARVHRRIDVEPVLYAPVWKSSLP